MQIWLDTADLDSAKRWEPHVSGFTTNPTLMRSAGVVDYEGFARSLLDLAGRKPVSFEVFADEPDDMRRQALRIAGWQGNTYVKVPITTPDGMSTAPLICELTRSSVRVNVTAVLTPDQVTAAAQALEGGPRAVVSVFAGRVADTGRNPVGVMLAAAHRLIGYPNVELLWASTREALNITQAEQAGCDIITVTPALLEKYQTMHDRDLDAVSLDTVRMFHTDARDSGYTL